MRKICILIVCLLLFLTIGGCSCTNSFSISKPKEIEKPVAQESKGLSKDQPNYNNPEDLTKTEPVKTEEIRSGDPLAVLRVNDLNVDNAAGMFYIKKGENFYTLNGGVATEIPGVDYGRVGTTHWGQRRVFENHVLGKTAIMTFGEVPIPVFEEGDTIVGYSPYRVPILELKEVSFGGYAVGVHSHVPLDLIKTTKDVILRVWDDDDPTTRIELKREDARTLKVINLDTDQEEEDYYHLEKEGRYLISWYHGTKYDELETTANCRIYERVSSEIYRVEGELAKEGYVIYDTSGVKPGIYAVGADGCGLVEFK